AICACTVLDFLFFQAEDGIRDDLVTGVQTCALPIYQRRRHPVARALHGRVSCRVPPARRDPTPPPSRRRSRPALRAELSPYECRSEERRVGKECGWVL